MRDLKKIHQPQCNQLFENLLLNKVRQNWSITHQLKNSKNTKGSRTFY